MIVNQLQIGYNIPNFLTVGKAHPAEKAVRHGAFGKNFLQILRLSVCPIEHGKVSVLPFFLAHHTVDRFGDIAGLSVLILQLFHMNRCSLAPGRP